MKIIKKSISIVGAMMLTLGLFSFQPSNSNEINIGETIAYPTTNNFETTTPMKSTKIFADVGKFVQKAVKEVELLVESARLQSPKKTLNAVKSPTELSDFILNQDTDYRLSRL